MAHWPGLAWHGVALAGSFCPDFAANTQTVTELISPRRIVEICSGGVTVASLAADWQPPRRPLKRGGRPSATSGSSHQISQLWRRQHDMTGAETLLGRVCTRATGFEVPVFGAHAMVTLRPRHGRRGAQRLPLISSQVACFHRVLK